MDNTRPPSDVNSLFSVRIDGLTNDATKEDLNNHFEKYGKIADIYIPRNAREGGNRGFGFVRFINKEDADKALEENGTTINGETVRVTMADMRPPRREYNLLYLFILGEGIEVEAMIAPLDTVAEVVVVDEDIAEVAAVALAVALAAAVMDVHITRQAVVIAVDAVIQVAPFLAAVRAADAIRILEIIVLFVLHFCFRLHIMSSTINIDVEFDAIIEWCRSRRQLPADWSIRLQKVTESIQEMNKVLTDNGIDALSDDYYEIKKSFEGLLSSRDSSKTLLGSYSDPVLASVASTLSKFESSNLFIADSALRLKQIVWHEIPSISRQVKEDERVCSSLTSRIQDIKRSIERKDESILAFKKEWLIQTDEMNEEAIVSDLVHCNDELQSLITSVLSTLQSPQMESLLHYYVCFDAYMQNKEVPEPIQSFFPSLTKASQTDFFINQNSRDLLLDDLYCLLTFLQERFRESGSSHHSLTVNCCQEIADCIGAMSLSLLQEGVELVQGVVKLIEEKIATLAHVVNDHSFQNTIAQDLLSEYKRREGMKQSIRSLEEKKKALQTTMGQRMKKGSELRRDAHRLTKLTEKAMNSLFPNVKITIVGAVLSL